MAWHDDLSLQVRRAGHGRIEVLEFKPQEHAVPVWLDVRISDATMMMLHLPSVQLQDQPAPRYQSLIILAAMRALTAEETLIPATARLDIAHANQGLWTHINFVVNDANLERVLVKVACMVEKEIEPGRHNASDFSNFRQ